MDIGQLSRPARVGEGEARLEAYCAGAVLNAALRLGRTGDLRMHLAAPTLGKALTGAAAQFPRDGGSGGTEWWTQGVWTAVQGSIRGATLPGGCG